MNKSSEIIKQQLKSPENGERKSSGEEIDQLKQRGRLRTSKPMKSGTLKPKGKTRDSRDKSESKRQEKSASTVAISCAGKEENVLRLVVCLKYNKSNHFA